MEWESSFWLYLLDLCGLLGRFASGSQAHAWSHGDFTDSTSEAKTQFELLFLKTFAIQQYALR
jgi:hypothetical protein